MHSCICMCAGRSAADDPVGGEGGARQRGERARRGGGVALAAAVGASGGGVYLMAAVVCVCVFVCLGAHGVLSVAWWVQHMVGA